MSQTSTQVAINISENQNKSNNKQISQNVQDDQQQNQNTKKPKKKQNAVFGGTSGLITGVLLQPLEIIKMFLMINPLHMKEIEQANFLRSFYIATRTIYAHEGAKGFFRGLPPALIRFVMSSAIYFQLLHDIEHILDQKTKNQTFVHFMSSAIARMLSGFFTNPLLIVKARLELTGFNEYKSTLDGLKKLYQEGGVKSFFKGSFVTSLRDGPYAGLWYTIFQKTKKFMGSPDSTLTDFVSGMVAGFISTSATQPFDVIRARLQTKFRGTDNDQQEYKGLTDAFKRIYKDEGFQGYFRGLFPRLMRKPLSNALSFSFFNLFNRFSASRSNQQ